MHLGLNKSLTTQEFLYSFKEFVARRDKPDLVISDNAKTFKAAADWTKTLETDDDLNNYLGQQSIKWKFNLSRAPWWGGFFERLVGIMKRSLTKQIGRALLTFDELKDALMDVETFMNNRPLTYLGEEAEQQVLTPNTLIKGSPTRFPVEDLEKIGYMEEDKLVTKRLAYLQKTKQLLKKRWLNEYLRGLKDQRNKVRPQEVPVPGSVVLITDHLSGNGFKPTWTLAKVLTHVKGKDGVIRGLELKSASGYTIQRPLELCRDLEIVKQIGEEKSTAPQFADGSTPTGDNFNQPDGEETSTTSSTTSQQMQLKAQRGTQRQAAASARITNQLLQQYEHEQML